MKLSDFPLILPVLTGKDISTFEMRDCVEEEAESPQESFTLDYIALSLAEIGSIPDGMHLTEFPGHYEGIDCWCRPAVIATHSAFVIKHKDLRRGEFDS